MSEREKRRWYQHPRRSQSHCLVSEVRRGLAEVVVSPMLAAGMLACLL